MHFSAAFTLALATLSIAAPTNRRSLEPRAAVLGTATYDDLSISGGVAGDAESEALAKLPIDVNDLANVDPADIAFLGDVNDIANDAETDAFNVAIEAATDDAEKTALENGKIKNKVLKLTATKLELMAKAAQGEDTADKLAAEQKKLDSNIALDAAAAGQESTALNFDAIAGSGAAAASTGDAAANGDAAATDEATADEEAATPAKGNKASNACAATADDE
ncbi:hypothetical protein BJ875DRAFT_494737 [Amylocarpus encephaloides]|uniref:Small secreted protein n=1 Tax=Amylocarpus encephaloides TaxID=45428 RepID=A0A9P7YM42_9HELO|nr:hypothetical protein BJ875DRAFT_494737 [Amylocarpus encephaloides]